MQDSTVKPNIPKLKKRIGIGIVILGIICVWFGGPVEPGWIRHLGFELMLFAAIYMLAQELDATKKLLMNYPQVIHTDNVNIKCNRCTMDGRITETE